MVRACNPSIWEAETHGLSRAGLIGLKKKQKKKQISNLRWFMPIILGLQEDQESMLALAT